jgi:hypothetical protein
MKNKSRFSLGVLSIVMLLIISSCKNENKDVFEIYSGTLTVLQKDAYSNYPGRNNILWPPHTTTVFEWNNGKEVHLNHGTAPEEKDANGTLMLTEIKVYNFTGTKSQLKALEEAYVYATCDSVDGKPFNTFLSMVEGKAELEKVVLKSLGDFITDDSNNFSHGNLTKEEVLQLIHSGDVSKLMLLLQGSGLSEAQLITAFNMILKNAFTELGHDIKDFHVCNDDANLQVELVKNFISTGKVQMPERVCDGPMIYYFPK